ncbi:MAG: SDR family NAD(P)-dependent oxidoreductase, partial [Candidatus Rokuibacteriota bacterium]
MDLGIKGKTALVTGGARSLGKQDCLALAAEGCKVIVLDLNGEGAAETAKEITTAGGTARGYAADITERAVLGDVLRRAESEVG